MPPKTIERPHLLDQIREMRAEILAIARSCKATDVRVFGSVARREEGPDSDVDFLVDFEANATLINHIQLEQKLSDLLGIKVDVVSSTALSPRLREEVERDVQSMTS
ncbi:MAG: nucleotidyltransferase family protein [Anaerolineae bacterium]|nr:nucleotidyltransferase family protein [Anaerolineae bacterium]